MKRESASEARFGSNGPWLAMLLTLALLTVPTAFLVNHEVPGPYMDEEFHVNQVQHYCQGDFAYWDAKITTFPGLYYVSLSYIGAIHSFAHILGFQLSAMDLCQPALLRSLNLVLCLVCCLLFRAILLHLDPRRNVIDTSMRALVLSLYPLHWFFVFLYYTELGSATAVMAMYLASLKKAYWTSALFGAMSVLMRQTNAVWIVFVVCAGVLDFVPLPPGEPDQDQKKEGWLATGDSQVAEAPIQKKSARPSDRTMSKENVVQSGEGKNLNEAGVRQRHRSTKNEEASPCESTHYETHREMTVDPGIFSDLLYLIRGVWFRRLDVLWNFGPLVLVFAAFVGFVLYNGGIVVGDQDAHTVSLHFAQLLYCGLVSAAFLAAAHFSPQNLGNFIHVLKASSKTRVFISGAIALSASFIAVHFFSVVHPYLIADNRHFVFYIWKDILRRHWSVRYAIIPIYIFSWWSVLRTLGQQQRALWILAYFLAIVGTLVPAPLLEFRYYNIPFYFLFMHTCQRMSNRSLALTAFQFLAVNLITMYMFLSWPFEWPSQPGKVQRFLW